MSALQFFHPASVDEAVTLLAASPLPVDSPTQRRIRGLTHLRDTFGSGRRRPEWVWGVRYADDPTPLGVVAAFGADAPDDRVFVLDHFGLPDDPAVARALVAHASAEAVAARGRGGRHLRADRRHPRRRVARLSRGPAACGGVAAPGRAAALRVRAAGGTGGRHRHAAVPRPAHRTRRPAPGRLPPRGHARHPRRPRHQIIATLGFEPACRESLAFLLDSDPVECIRLATDAAGSLVGLVSGRLMSSGRAFVLFVGVCRDHRGRGFGRELLAWQTRELIASGATVLIADTDNTNVPMARAFADVGWPQTETRIDLVR